MKSTRIFGGIWFLLSILGYLVTASYLWLEICMGMAAVGCIFGILVLFTGKGLKFRIQLPAGAEKKQKTEGKLIVENSSLLPVFHGRTCFYIENYLTGERKKVPVEFAVFSRGKSSTDFQIESQYCGNLRFRIEEVSVADPFYLFTRKRKGKAVKDLLILPGVIEPAIQLSSREAYDMESFSYSSAKKGDDSSETFEIREYQTSDSMRQIHWKLTQKLGEFMVREKSYPIQNTILVLLETGFPGKEKREPAVMDALAEVGTGILHRFYGQGLSFEVGVYDHKEQKLHRKRIENSEDIWEMTAVFVKAQRKQTEETVIRHYLEQETGVFARCLYLTAGEVSSDAELLAERGPVTILCCGGQALAGESVYMFTPEHWQEELAGISL